MYGSNLKKNLQLKHTRGSVSIDRDRKKESKYAQSNTTSA